MTIYRLKSKLVLLFFLIIATASCKKDEPQVPIVDNTCKLISIQTSGMGMGSKDSLIYANGKVARVINTMASFPPEITDYIYYGRDSVQLMKGNQLQTAYYFDSQQRIVRATDFVNASTILFSYDAGDSIRMTIDGELAFVIYLNNQGNMTYVRNLVDGEADEVYITYDTKTNVYKGLLHGGYFLQTISKNNMRTQHEYENGVLVSSTNFALTYTGTGQLSRLKLDEGLFQLDFSYSCP